MKTITINLAPFYGLPARTQTIQFKEEEFSQDFVIDEHFQYNIKFYLQDGPEVTITTSYKFPDGSGGFTSWTAKIENNKINWHTLDNPTQPFNPEYAKQADICLAELFKFKGFL